MLASSPVSTDYSAPPSHTPLVYSSVHTLYPRTPDLPPAKTPLHHTPGDYLHHPAVIPVLWWVVRGMVTYLASILPLLPPCTEEPWVQQEVLPQPGLPELLLALRLAHHGHVHLLQHILVGASRAKSIFPPPTHPTALPAEVLHTYILYLYVVV